MSYGTLSGFVTSEDELEAVEASWNEEVTIGEDSRWE